jgi:spermidine synthase
VPTNAPPLRYLNQQVLDAAGVFPGDVGPRPVEPSTLENPRIVEDMRHGYD